MVQWCTGELVLNNQSFSNFPSVRRPASIIARKSYDRESTSERIHTLFKMRLLEGSSAGIYCRALAGGRGLAWLIALPCFVCLIAHERVIQQITVVLWEHHENIALALLKAAAERREQLLALDEVRVHLSRGCCRRLSLLAKSPRCVLGHLLAGTQRRKFSARARNSWLVSSWPRELILLFCM